MVTFLPLKIKVFNENKYCTSLLDTLYNIVTPEEDTKLSTLSLCLS